MNAEPPLDAGSKALVAEGEAEATTRAGRLRRLGAEPPPKKLSEILQTVAQDSTAERITVGDLLRAMEGRAIAALLLVFAFPNILPTPPGLAGILGLPLIYLSSQLMLGRTPWLPPFISKRSITRDTFVTLVTRAIPWLARAEKMLKQRLWPLASPPAQRFLGAVCLILSLVLALPIPFGNMLPSIAICVLALGLLERDGFWILAGLISAVIATGIVGSFAYALIRSAIFIVFNAF